MSTRKTKSVADEEAGSHFGSHFLISEHAEEVQGDCVFSEVGGFNIDVNGNELWPIAVGEKSMANVRLRFKGPGGS